jgi:hypothetical protein
LKFLEKDHKLVGDYGGGSCRIYRKDNSADEYTLDNFRDHNVSIDPKFAEYLLTQV